MYYGFTLRALKLHILFFITIFFALGIVWYANFPMPRLTLAGIGILLVLLISRKKKNYIFFSSAFALGSLLYHNQQVQYENFYTFLENNKFDAIATVINIETTADRQRKKYCILAQIKSLKKMTQPTNWQDCNKTIALYSQQKPAFNIKDVILLKNLSCKKPANRSFENYLIKNNIAATCFTNNLDYKLISRPKASLWRWIFYTREKLLNRIKKKMSANTFAFFCSIFLGNRTTVKQQLEHTKEQCKMWGISHLLARSGLHLMVFVSTCSFIFQFIPAPFMIKQLLMFFLSCIYFMLSWPSISFIRAFILFIFYKICILAKVQTNFLHLLTLTTLLVLLFNPIQLFFLDFQLSFGLTMALAWFGLVTQKIGSNQTKD